jgi:hypothetical protein
MTLVVMVMAFTAVQARRNYKAGHDLDVSQHPCRGNNTQYCVGYNRGYSDEADFLRVKGQT